MHKTSTSRKSSTSKADAAKTSPRGMAPDRSHASHGFSVGKRNSVTEETFENSPNNAGLTQTRREEGGR